MPDTKNKPPFYLIDTNADFYRPFGVRLAICISVVCWAALEIYNRDGFWGILSGAAAVYCIYTLFLTYNPPPKDESGVGAEEPDEEAGTDEESKADDKV